MTDFVRSLKDAEQEIVDRVDGEAARRRVARRLGRRRTALERARVPAFAMALAAICVGFGYWLGTGVVTHHREPIAAITADAPQPGGGRMDPAAPAPMVATLGQLLAEQEDGSCEFTVNSKSYGDLETLDMPLPAGEHDVYCRRGPKAQHQRLTIAAGKTTRVVFQFADNVVEELDGGTTPEPAIEKSKQGTLVAIAVGGSCLFTVDGAAKGTKSSIRLKVDIGRHTVTCRPSTGPIRTQRVTVTKDRPGIASFKL